MTNRQELFTIGTFTVKVGNALTFVVCTLLLWSTHLLILQGVSSAGKINFVATATKVIGPIGAKLLAGLGLISLVGSTIGWVMLSAELPYQAAKQGLFLDAFLKENKNGIPVFSLIVTNLLGQLFIFSTISSSISAAFDFVIIIATLSYLVPYFISSFFQLKLAVTGETYELQPQSRWTDGIIAVISTLYSVWVIIAGTADIKKFMFGIGLLLSGIFFYRNVQKSAIQK